ncbi:MAG: ADP-glyceromanno-heptose 6-epimerase [Alphaproteobacteria bacterium]|jgi:ADP-L-glycero-D-manno-heptose 6-epimerase|nr:ADP-glyceromanno-heptose 6-epimerase [Alphaproteobacteria bacterium]MBT4016782.1 ADP-glyceromanno-heptose 6-epimerase [Alphaproteobacteria bacterium]MBT5158720.1 ADP-glyceromanno-heptose 6-epimerase [Alphaproteobacteria bacterium]MBT5917067.1 ADP-glyceromanno-heptose 6-epimerase [Alphaproteobacteria bacterium]MBT6385653.1 ADP-glyceromanno-heptose 6-epimerase [Alphaproteobacteria bacterium]
MIVVTGGAGFIGANIVAALEARGISEIVVCDWLGHEDKWRNIAKRELAGVVPPEDLFDFLHMEAGNVEAIFHMGAISATTETDGDRIMENNFQLSMDLWQWCEAHNARLIYASSAATYGDGQQGFDDDGSADGLKKLQPLNLYGWSKHLFDRRIARLVADGAGTPRQWAGLKFFNVYGPNEYHKGNMRSVVAQVHESITSGRPVMLFKSHHADYEDGGQLRDFVYIDDCVDVMMWLYDNPDVSGLFNLGTGKARTFADLATAVYSALGKEADFSFIDTPVEIRDKYQYFTQAHMGRLLSAGYDAPFTELEQGVQKYVQDFLEKDDPYR